MTETSILQTGIDTRPMKLEPLWLVTFQAPSEDVQRIYDEIIKHVALRHGKTDKNAYCAAEGVEFYRPLEGTPTGAENDVRKRPGVQEVRFFLPRVAAELEKVIEAIYQVHSYYEPVITVQEILRSASKGLDDNDNPNRWWNNTGDWKQSDG